MSRVYLDYNATAPLRPEARAAMIEAMDLVGNPSSVHAEGRAAKALIERARAQVARLVGAEPADIVFTSGTTEAANTVLGGGWDVIITGPLEHDATWAAWQYRASQGGKAPWWPLGVEPTGQYRAYDFDGAWDEEGADRSLAENRTLIAFHGANSETGVLQPIETAAALRARKNLSVYFDAAQVAGRMRLDLGRLGFDYSAFSAHKLGGPKGIGALVLRPGVELMPQIRGGGQEMGRRSGTENVIAIAGFGRAAAAVIQDIENGTWERVAELRNILEKRLEARADSTIFVGKESARLPNTTCLVTPGWKGETQVMQMDLAGFAISAGSACSSGKVKASAVLRAMGFSEADAASAIRVSLGPETTLDQIDAFAEAWGDAHDRFRARAKG